MPKDVLNDYQLDKLGGFEGRGWFLSWKDDRALFNTYTLFLGIRDTGIIHNYDHYAQQLYDRKVPPWWTIT